MGQYAVWQHIRVELVSTAWGFRQVVSGKGFYRRIDKQIQRHAACFLHTRLHLNSYQDWVSRQWWHFPKLAELSAYNFSLELWRCTDATFWFSFTYLKHSLQNGLPKCKSISKTYFLRIKEKTLLIISHYACTHFICSSSVMQIMNSVIHTSICR